MSNLAKLEFVPLDITGKNFLSWILDVEIHLDANGLGNTIKEKNTTSIQEKSKAMIFLRHHLHEGIRNLSSVSSISIALLFFYFIIRYHNGKGSKIPKANIDIRELMIRYIIDANIDTLSVSKDFSVQ